MHAASVISTTCTIVCEKSVEEDVRDSFDCELQVRINEIETHSVISTTCM